MDKILIANRGEIALRIIWACKEMGIKTVAVHSDVDEDSLHVRFADESVCIGPAKSISSYLNITSIISAAEISGANAIHPGYGFLAENPYFAEICGDCNIKFIGPRPETIRLMGDKSHAIEEMKKAGVPTIPGSDGPITDTDEAIRLAADIGYPVILKASAGGGGKGMRVVNSAKEFVPAFEAAKNEAQAAFDNPAVYMEKYLINPRHIEFQILADEHGNVVHLGERECSIQRKHQKLLEESPSTALDPKLRINMGSIAVKAAEQAGYWNAGTIEFLLDKNKNFYFMEMNTRIQVEHPVTECVTGIDLIREQIKTAMGEKLGFKQKDINIQGHSIECRINAEDPETFIPSPGTISVFNPPGGIGIRLDTAAYANYTVLPYYDSMIGKLISFGSDRNEAAERMRRALDVFVVEGIKTTIPLHQKILSDRKFLAGKLSTGFMDTFLKRKDG